MSCWLNADLVVEVQGGGQGADWRCCSSPPPGSCSLSSWRGHLDWHWLAIPHSLAIKWSPCPRVLIFCPWVLQPLTWQHSSDGISPSPLPVQSCCRWSPVQHQKHWNTEYKQKATLSRSFFDAFYHMSHCKALFSTSFNQSRANLSYSHNGVLCLWLACTAGADCQLCMAAVASLFYSSTQPCHQVARVAYALQWNPLQSVRWCNCSTVEMVINNVDS